MVKGPSKGASASETNAINLTRMVARLQHILVTPDSTTEARLRTNRFERDKVGTVRSSFNIESLKLTLSIES